MHRLLILVLVVIPVYASAQADSLAATSGNRSGGKPRLFVDCQDGCDQDYLKSELTFVDYVRDKDLADVHLLVTTSGAGNMGTEYTLGFVGYGRFSGMEDTLRFVTKASDTDDMVRKSLARMIRLGLMRYIAHTPLAGEAEIAFPGRNVPTLPGSDPWDSWIFNIDASAEFDGEKSSKDIKLSNVLSANRITNELKVQIGMSTQYAENRFDIADGTILSISRSEKFSSLVALGLNDHWSLGLFGTLSSSTYDNTKLSASIGPAIECDLFPYAEHSRRQLPIAYRISYIRNAYFQETIYDRISQSLLSHTLSLGLSLKELWGTASVTAEGSQYLHDLRKNRLVLDSKLSFRLVEGLSVWLAGTVSIIHDQLGLPSSGASPEEILLRRRELETSFYYYAGIGLSYTFGSIYSNIVNPRFGD
jgi:hypothetical protein